MIDKRTKRKKKHKKKNCIKSKIYQNLLYEEQKHVFHIIYIICILLLVLVQKKFYVFLIHYVGGI